MSAAVRQDMLDHNIPNKILLFKVSPLQKYIANSNFRKIYGGAIQEKRHQAKILPEIEEILRFSVDFLFLC